MKLKFVYAASEELSVAIDFFEQEKIQVHHAREKMEKILYRHLQKAVKEEFINNLDEENNDISKKSGHELLNVVVDEKTFLDNKDLFIGHEVEKEIKQLGLRPSSVQLSWLYDIVRNFHKTVVKFLQKYFTTALKSSVMDNMSALSPHKQCNILTSRKLKALAMQYSKVVDNIEPFGGMDSLKEEIDRYVVDDDIKEIEKGSGFEQYWTEVGNLTDGEARWERFSILPRFAFSMAVKHNDTSVVERQFTVMNNIHQDKQRNAMSQDMLDSNLHVRSGVESKQNRKKCHKCSEPKPTPHCHCTLAEVTPEMRQNCVKAWEKCKAAQLKASAEKKDVSTEMVERREVLDRIEAERINKLKEELRQRAAFCSPSLFKRVYPSEKEIKAAEASKNLAVESGRMVGANKKNLAEAPKVTSKDNEKTVKTGGEHKRKLADVSKATSKGDGTIKKLEVSNIFSKPGQGKKMKK